MDRHGVEDSEKKREGTDCTDRYRRGRRLGRRRPGTITVEPREGGDEVLEDTEKDCVSTFFGSFGPPPSSNGGFCESYLIRGSGPLGFEWEL